MNNGVNWGVYRQMVVGVSILIIAGFLAWIGLTLQSVDKGVAVLISVTSSNTARIEKLEDEAR